jgi:hypothetical protein
MVHVIIMLDKYGYRHTLRIFTAFLWQKWLHNTYIASLLFEVDKSNPIRGLDRPLGFQEVETPRFVDNRHMKVVRLSGLSAGRLYPPGNTPGTHFC